jgi:transcription elongation factor Elf1
MDDDKDETPDEFYDCVDPETVTPDGTVGQQPGICSPTPQLGLLHKDYSDDNSESSDDPPIQPPSAPARLPSSIAQFPQTLFELPSSQLQMTNVTLPLSKLHEFMDSSFKCRSCNSAKGKQFSLERYGIATSLYFKCNNCGLASSCRADLTLDLENKWAAKPAAMKFKDAKKDTVNASDFDLNNKLYLATQQCGGGLTEAKVFSGILGMHTNALKG